MGEEAEKVEEEIRKGFGFRPFEVDLAYEFTIEGTRMTPKSTWIKYHLEDVERDYPYRMWLRFVAWVVKNDLDLDPGGYDDFNNHLWRLRQLNLVEVIERAPTVRAGNPEWGRALHRLVEENIESPAWLNPTRYLYPYTSRKWIKEKLDEGLSPSEIAERAEEVSLRDIEVTEEQIRRRIELWDL